MWEPILLEYLIITLFLFFVQYRYFFSFWSACKCINHKMIKKITSCDINLSFIHAACKYFPLLHKIGTKWPSVGGRVKNFHLHSIGMFGSIYSNSRQDTENITNVDFISTFLPSKKPMLISRTPHHEDNKFWFINFSAL